MGAREQGTRRLHESPGPDGGLRTGTDAEAERWLILAATSRGSAERWAHRTGLPVAAIADRFDVVASRGRIDRLAAEAGAKNICLHSLDWSRETMPQLWILALARAGCTVELTDEGSGDQAAVLDGRAASGAGAIAQIVAGTIAGVGEVVRVIRASRSARPPGVAIEPRSVLAVWPGSLAGSVGGSVTHAAGILGAFRRRGLRVVVVTAFEPPDQLRRAVDDVIVLPPPRAGRRLNADSHRLAINAALRSHLPRALAALDAPFIYVRHQALIVAPAEVAQRHGVKLVVEWNASERWALENWTRSPSFIKRLTLPLVGVFERALVRGSDVIAAVSREAGQMAIDAGGRAGQILTVPNAVDLAQIDRVLSDAGVTPGAALEATSAPPVVGWVGTFGEWHGAEVLIEAVSRAATSLRLVMIGDGSTRRACEALSAELGLADRIEFRGQVPHDEAIRALAACDLLAVPHVPLRDQPFFGSPTKLFEYMALTRPIVASRLAQIGEVLVDRETGLLVPPGDAGELAAALDEVCASPDLAKRIALGARRDAEARHTWAARAEQVLTALSAR